MFDKNVIKPGDNIEYIKEAADTVAILCAKQKYNYKDNIPAYLKVSLNQTTKIKLTKVMNLLHS